jgi:hypothetical protein
MKFSHTFLSYRLISLITLEYKQQKMHIRTQPQQPKMTRHTTQRERAASPKKTTTQKKKLQNKTKIAKRKGISVSKN